LSVRYIAILEKDLFIDLFKRAPLATLIFGLEWLLMNGVWYLIAGLNLGWISVFARAYLVFLWSPLSVEKAFQIPLAFYLAKKIKLIRKEKKYAVEVWSKKHSVQY
jgi:hypothetical protein